MAGGIDRNFCVWITGLPGSGKSTIARELEKKIIQETDIDITTLNLDRIRKVLTPEPRYTVEEREIVYRALVLMAKLLVEQGSRNVIIDATGNRRKFRNLARDLIPGYAEVYVKCPLELCQEREASRNSQIVEKNLYEKAKGGRLKGDMPGVSTPYEEPEHPEVQVRSDELTPAESAARILDYIESRWV